MDINNRLDRACALMGSVDTWLSEQENIGNVCPLEHTTPETVLLARELIASFFGLVFIHSFIRGGCTP